MTASKLRDREEFIRWYTEGKTYAWIIDQYKEKYDLEIGHGNISNWRHQLGLEKRTVRGSELVPWAIKREHRTSHLLHMLRAEARRRAGQPVAPDQLRKLDGWLRRVLAEGAVVHYDPDTEQGWWLVPRRPGIDTDLIRVPDEVTRQRGSRE